MRWVEQFDDVSLAKYFKKFYERIVVLDENKYLAPRFSAALKDLAVHFGIFESPSRGLSPSASSTSSNMSFCHFQAKNARVPAALRTASKQTRRHK